MKPFLVLALSQLIFISASIAQTGVSRVTPGTTRIWDGKITGKVIENETKQPIEFANIGLYHSGVEMPMDGTVSDGQGSFKFKNLKPGVYRVEVTFLGFETQSIDSLEITDKKTSAATGTILLSPKNKTLREATVQGEKSLIETRIDKLVYNASKDITSKGGNATDVLRKVPMVTVDLDGNVSLQGTQNVKILINNKPSSLLAGSVDVAMKLIPASEIERIEVITSPSAKYDAEGTGGIINIVTKRKSMAGTNGSVDVSAGNRYSSLNGTVNYKNGRFGTGLSIGASGYQGKGDLTTERITTDTSGTVTLREVGPNKLFGRGPFISWTTDIDVTTKNTISTSLQGFGFYQDIDKDNSNYVNDVNLYNSTGKSGNDELGYDALVEYQRDFENTDRDWTVTLQQSTSKEITDYDVERDFIDTAFYNSFEASRNENVGRETTIQTDFTNPFSKKVTLEAGAKALLRNVTSDSKTDLSNPTPGFPETNIVTVFNYDQNIYAAYAVGTLSLKKFGLKVGGRFEQTDLHGDQDADSTKFSDNYYNLVPSLTVSYMESGKYQLKFSYTQRIHRPSMTHLNPYKNTNDPLNISYGNPHLDAEVSHAFELGYSFFKDFGSINITAFHRFTDNAIEQYSFLNGQIYETTYGNIGQNYTDGASIGTNLRKHNLTVSVNASGYYYEINTSQPQLPANNTGFNYNLNLFTSYKINDYWTLQGWGSFNGPNYSVQGYSTSFYFYNVSGRREFKNKKGGFGFGIDNFATPYIHIKSKYEGSDFSYTSDNKIFFPGVRVSFDYRFGQMEFGSKRKKKIKNDDLKEGGGGGFGGGGDEGGEEKK